MIKVRRESDCRCRKCRRNNKATLILSDPIIYWYSQNQTVVGITHITAPAPLASQAGAKLYPSLPTRRHSYSNSPDSAIVSTRPSFSSTLPCPNSRFVILSNVVGQSYIMILPGLEALPTRCLSTSPIRCQHQ